MSKLKKILKNNYKLILGIILGLIWSMGIAYAATIYYASVNVSYDNTSSGLEATNVQGALDELYANSNAYLAGLNAAHPVGSYLETSNSSFDPNVSIGGTWTSTTIKDDFIVEEGTSNGWTYRKWNSGIADCWKKWENASFSGTAVNGWYGRALTSAVYFPNNLYIDTPRVFFNLDYWNTGYYWGNARGPSAEGTSLTVLNNSNAAAVGYGSIYAIGLWKTYTAPSTIYRWHRTA